MTPPWGLSRSEVEPTWVDFPLNQGSESEEYAFYPVVTNRSSFL